MPRQTRAPPTSNPGGTMTAVNTVLSGTPKRVLTTLWVAAGLMFFIAVIRSLNFPPTQDWMSSRVQGVMGGSSGRLSLKDHVRRAEAAWAHTVKQRHDMIRADYGTIKKMGLYPAQDAESYGVHPYTIWDFTPASWACPHEVERVGRMGDGGKWVCGMSRYESLPASSPCVIYSFGVRDESSFENDMLSRTHCKVWAYDFSVVDFGVQLEPSNRGRAQFLQAGISGTTDKTQNPPFYSIAELMRMNGHEYIDILKMDIEFAEFEAMEGLIRDFPLTAGKDLPIGQLLIEIHLFAGKMDAEGYLTWWERMENRGLRPTWTEPNLLAVTMNVNGDKNPMMAEYTLLNVRDSRSVLFGGAALTLGS